MVGTRPGVSRGGWWWHTITGLSHTDADLGRLAVVSRAMLVWSTGLGRRAIQHYVMTDTRTEAAPAPDGRNGSRAGAQDEARAGHRWAHFSTACWGSPEPVQRRSRMRGAGWRRHSKTIRVARHARNHMRSVLCSVGCRRPGPMPLRMFGPRLCLPRSVPHASAHHLQ